jgi:cytochrome b
VSGADWVWGGLVAAGAGFEAYALANARAGDTLSETTRRLFRTRHPVGALAFTAAWLGFSAWYLAHILD